MPRSLWALLALVGVTVAWGSTFAITKVALDTIAPSDFLFWRFALAAVLLALVNPGSLRRLDRADVRRGGILSVVLAASYLLQTVGLQYTAPTVSGFITGMFLVFVPLISAVVLRRRVPALAWLAVAVATAGLALLSLRGFAVGFGEVLTLLAAIGFAAHLVGLGEWSRSDTAYGLTVVQLGGAAVLTGAAAAADGRLDVPASGGMWLTVGYMALAATALAYLLQSWAIPILGSVRSAVVLTLEPVFAGVFGVMLTGDIITWRTAVGGALILVAMLLVELAPRAPTPRPDPLVA